MASEKGLIPDTNKDVFGKRTVDAKVAKFAPFRKSDPIDCKYGLRKGIPRDSAKNNSTFKSLDPVHSTCK